MLPLELEVNLDIIHLFSSTALHVGKFVCASNDADYSCSVSICHAVQVLGLFSLHDFPVPFHGSVSKVAYQYITVHSLYPLLSEAVISLYSFAPVTRLQHYSSTS